MAFIISIISPELKCGKIAPKITEIPLTPPVEKLFGNLKKYIPSAIRTVPKVMIINSLIFLYRYDIIKTKAALAVTCRFFCNIRKQQN